MAEKRAHRVHLRMTCGRHAAGVIDFFQDDARFGDAQTGAAKFFRNQRGEPAQLGEFAHECFGIFFFSVNLAPVRIGKIFAHSFDFFSNLLLLWR